MKKITVTFKTMGTGFKVVKSVNTTKFIPGQYISLAEIEKLMKRVDSKTDYILT